MKIEKNAIYAQFSATRPYLIHNHLKITHN